MKWFLVVLFSISQNINAETTCPKFSCSADEIYIDSLVGKNNCQVESKVSCFFNAYAAKVNFSSSALKKDNRKKNENLKKQLEQALNLEGLLKKAEKSYKSNCLGDPTGDALIDCLISIEYARTAYHKADSVARSMGFPHFKSKKAFYEVVKLFQLGEKNKKRYKYFLTESHNIQIRKSLNLWSRIQESLAESEIKAKNFVLCQDAHYSVNHTIAQEKLVFLSAKIKKIYNTLVDSIKRLDEAISVAEEYKKNCDKPTEIDLPLKNGKALRSEILKFSESIL